MKPVNVTLAVVSSLLLAVLNATSAAPSALSPPSSLAERLEHSAPLIVAHRGCIEFGPENSLAALKACFPLGIDMA